MHPSVFESGISVFEISKSVRVADSETNFIVFICSLFNNAATDPNDRLLRRIIRWSRIMKWKAYWKKRSWPVLKHYPGICLDGLRKHRYSSGVPPEIRSGHLKNTSLKLHRLRQLSLCGSKEQQTFVLLILSYNIFWPAANCLRLKQCGTQTTFYYHAWCNRIKKPSSWAVFALWARQEVALVPCVTTVASVGPEQIIRRKRFSAHKPI
jgi:hypothetical protein